MRRPGTQCLNCGHCLTTDDNFCPNCGQKNSDQQVSIFMLIGDFLSNYFSVDSKLGRSLRHFFFQPGYLTNCFNEGKRVHFVHPLRLYLVITFLFFLILSLFLTSDLEDASVQNIARGIQDNGQLEKTDSIKVTLGWEKLPEHVSSPSRGDYSEKGMNIQHILSLLRDVSLTDEMVLDSLEIDKTTQQNGLFQILTHQGRRVIQKDMDVFIPYVLKNLPLMMFILLPVFAFYAMCLYKNKPNLYIRHLIHSLHIHSMAFLLLTVFILTAWLSGSFFTGTAFFLITLYAFLSVKMVYRQTWRRTAWKFMVLGMFYFSTLFFFIILELGISFLTF